MFFDCLYCLFLPRWLRLYTASGVLIVVRARCKGAAVSAEFIHKFWHQLSNKHSQWSAVQAIRDDCGQYSSAFTATDWTTLQCAVSV